MRSATLNIPKYSVDIYPAKRKIVGALEYLKMLQSNKYNIISVKIHIPKITSSDTVKFIVEYE